jgi:hypothetical protein
MDSDSDSDSITQAQGDRVIDLLGEISAGIHSLRETLYAAHTELQNIKVRVGRIEGHLEKMQPPRQDSGPAPHS